MSRPETTKKPGTGVCFKSRNFKRTFSEEIFVTNYGRSSLPKPPCRKKSAAHLQARKKQQVNQQLQTAYQQNRRQVPENQSRRPVTADPNFGAGRALEAQLHRSYTEPATKGPAEEERETRGCRKSAAFLVSGGPTLNAVCYFRNLPITADLQSGSVRICTPYEVHYVHTA